MSVGQDLVLGTSPTKEYVPKRRLRWKLVVFTKEADAFFRLLVRFVHQKLPLGMEAEPTSPHAGAHITRLKNLI